MWGWTWGKPQIEAPAPHPIQNLEPRLTHSFSATAPSPIRRITFQPLGREMARPCVRSTRGATLTLAQPASSPRRLGFVEPARSQRGVADRVLHIGVAEPVLHDAHVLPPIGHEEAAGMP